MLNSLKNRLREYQSSINEGAVKKCKVGKQKSVLWYRCCGIIKSKEERTACCRYKIYFGSSANKVLNLCLLVFALRAFYEILVLINPNLFKLKKKALKSSVKAAKSVNSRSGCTQIKRVNKKNYHKNVMIMDKSRKSARTAVTELFTPCPVDLDRTDFENKDSRREGKAA